MCSRRRLIPLILPVILCSAAMARAQDFSPEEIQKLRVLFREARSHFINEDYKKSNAAYKELLNVLPETRGKLDTTRARVHYQMSCNYMLLGEKKTGLATLGKAIDLGFWDVNALQNDEAFESVRGDKAFAAQVQHCQEALGGMAFGLKTLDGKALKKKDHKGKVLIVDVWGTWCPPCRLEIPHFIRLQKKYRSQGLRIIGLTWERRPPNTAVTQQVRKFATSQKINYPLVMIPKELLAAVGASNFPTTFFIGRDGTVRQKLVELQTYSKLESEALKLLKESAPKAGGKNTGKNTANPAS